MNIFETKGDSQEKKNQTTYRERRERQQKPGVVYSSTSFKIQHDGIEKCVSMRDMYVCIYTHTYISCTCTGIIPDAKNCKNVLHI